MSTKLDQALVADFALVQAPPDSDLADSDPPDSDLADTRITRHDGLPGGENRSRFANVVYPTGGAHGGVPSGFAAVTPRRFAGVSPRRCAGVTPRLAGVMPRLAAVMPKRLAAVSPRVARRSGTPRRCFGWPAI